MQKTKHKNVIECDATRNNLNWNQIPSKSLLSAMPSNSTINRNRVALLKKSIRGKFLKDWPEILWKDT